MTDELVERRRAAALKGWETRRFKAELNAVPFIPGAMVHTSRGTYKAVLNLDAGEDAGGPVIPLTEGRSFRVLPNGDVVEIVPVDLDASRKG